jgi:hypothetical protein
MLDRRGRSVAAGIVISAVAAVALAGCGGGGGTTTVTAAAATTSTTATGTTTTSGGSGGTGSGGGGGAKGGGASNALAGIKPPPGSKKLNSRAGDGVVYVRYSTNVSPANVISSYNHQLTGAGWSIVNRGGSGGGWGPYGGSSSGLTAKKDETDFVDVQAGGQKGQKSYFEVCATSGKGTRSSCDQFSDQANHHTHSGGSQSGSNNNNNTNSGGS